MILVFAMVFALFEEGATFWDGLWTAYITLTTIGYGDFSAHSFQGRLVTVMTSMFGIGCFGVFTGIIVEKAMQRRLRKMKGEGTFNGEGHLVIVNVPSYEEIRELLHELDFSPDFRDLPRVIVTQHLPNNDREIPNQIADAIDGFIMGLPSALETLERANLPHAKACLLLASNLDPGVDDTNTLTAALIERNWNRVITVISCTRSETMNNLNLFHIDGGISATDLQMGLLVQELESQGIFKVYSELTSNSGGTQFYISRSLVREWNPKSVPMTLGQLKIAILQLDIPATLVGIKRQAENELILKPKNKIELLASDRLVYISEERLDWAKWGPQILQILSK